MNEIPDVPTVPAPAVEAGAAMPPYATADELAEDLARLLREGLVSFTRIGDDWPRFWPTKAGLAYGQHSDSEPRG